ncbi:hypothetical protein PP940_gp184 [Rhizobium phage RL2RES]|uniref:Uncharacterized protein n=1 Tax=Rhizobium phage RL2RES TaxID=103371 RepID=A0A6B9J1X5_9CAUD|nr:hypothetical protein PP940_gp184 [Rhizobium phage RL2RES]QGZ14247.1 hypothetical protein RL2RES_184 [Rhizobium phage RL2RES]
MKIIGSELILFLREAWPEPHDNWYWDNDLFEDRPDGEPDPVKFYDTDELGPIMYQGPGDDPSNGGYDIAKLVRKWRKEKTTEIYSVEIPKGKKDELVEFLDVINGKIMK